MLAVCKYDGGLRTLCPELNPFQESDKLLIREASKCIVKNNLLCAWGSLDLPYYSIYSTMRGGGNFNFLFAFNFFPILKNAGQEMQIQFVMCSNIFIYATKYE